MVRDSKTQCLDNVKLNDAHTLHTNSLKSPVHSGNPKGTDMPGIQKIPNSCGGT